MTHLKNLGLRKNLDVIQQYVVLPGTRVVDAGCGDLSVSKQLASCDARVVAIDPDPVQARLNRAAEPIENVEFIEAGADQLPLSAGTADGIFFCYSLHHIPAELYPQVFHEVQRVLKPGGYLFVIEPIACPLNDVMKLFHNEDQERAEAQKALHEFAVPLFEFVDQATYHSITQYDDFNQFANHFSNRSFNSLYTSEDVRKPEVKAAFERLGAPHYRFESPKQVMCLRGLRETIH